MRTLDNDMIMKMEDGFYFYEYWKPPQDACWVGPFTNTETAKVGQEILLLDNYIHA